MAQLLPVDLQDPVEDLEAGAGAVEYGRSWEWRFPPCQCGRDYPHLEVVGHRPLPTEGLETLVQWMRFALSIDRGSYPIYSTDFGVEFSALVSRSASRDEAETEVVRMVREALSVDPRVEQVRYIRLEEVEENPSAILIDIEVATFTADIQRLSLLASLEV